MPRWILRDVAASEQWEMPISPNKMTSPHAPKNMTIFARQAGRTGSSAFNGGVTRVLQFRQAPYEWSFSGIIRSQAHYDDFVYWTSKTGKLQVDDHLGRTWEIRIDNIELDERKPSFLRDWRYDYTVKTIMYGRVPSP